ncbi:MAG: hypothetical protein KIS81_09305 [Maricaulaceae bacterium]|nr:hypothetical protein [Maricaulaceae bacterium]
MLRLASLVLLLVLPACGEAATASHAAVELRDPIAYPDAWSEGLPEDVAAELFSSEFTEAEFPGVEAFDPTCSQARHMTASDSPLSFWVDCRTAPGFTEFHLYDVASDAVVQTRVIIATVQGRQP